MWDDAVAAVPAGRRSWLHGDVTASNLLVRDGELSAVIDWGCLGVGDPACDLMMAWTFFTGAARDAFRDRLGLDDETWVRARGWTLWKALITMVRDREAPRAGAPAPFGWRLDARGVVAEVLADAGYRTGAPP